MTTATDDNTRLGRLEGRLEEQSITLQELREGQRELRARPDNGIPDVYTRIDTSFRDLHTRPDAGLREVRVGQRQILIAIITAGTAVTLAVLGLAATIALRGV